MPDLWQREKSIKLGQLIAEVQGATLTGREDVDIDSLEYDSRQVKKNGLFIAVKGFHSDGYDYVRQARENGAIAVMGERESCPEIDNHVQVPDIRRAMAEVAARFYDYPGRKIKACGVTGTNGKTTTCYLLREIFRARRKVVGMVTSQTYDTGTHLFAAERTTPESLDLQRLLYLMQDNGVSHVIIEVSSHALALNRVDHIDFTVAVYTNLSRDHLDFHESMEEYFQAKAKLAGMLKGETSYAVINLDVAEFRPLFDQLHCSFLSYSMENPKADVRPGNCKLRPDGTTFDLITPMGTHAVDFKLAGRFNLQNAIAAAAGGLGCGLDLESVVQGLETATPVPGRLSPVECGQPFAVYVDFAHTPDALMRLCETVREFTAGNLLLLFGCGGDRDRGKRPIMGQVATENADYAVITSDNPRSENQMMIIEDIMPGLTGGRYEIETDRAQAIDSILQRAEPGDCVLLAGKGAEDYQEIEGEKLTFSDTAHAETTLARLGFEKTQTTEGI